MLEALPYKTSYYVNISSEDFDLIEIRDKVAIKYHHKTLMDLLIDIDDIWDVEYNGHFGSRIFFSCTVENRQNVNLALACIEKYIEEANDASSKSN